MSMFINCRDNMPIPPAPAEGTINVSLPEGPYNNSVIVYVNPTGEGPTSLEYISGSTTEHSFQVSPADYEFSASLCPTMLISNEEYHFYVNADEIYDIRFTW